MLALLRRSTVPFGTGIFKRFVQGASVDKQHSNRPPKRPEWLPIELESAFSSYRQHILAEYDNLTNSLSTQEPTSSLSGLASRWEELSPIVNVFQQLDLLLEHDADVESLVSDILKAGEESDEEDLLEIARLETDQRCTHRKALEEKLLDLMLPNELNGLIAEANVELVAAAGGLEAGLFARDLFNMYRSLSVERGWQFHVLRENAFQSEGGTNDALAHAKIEIIGHPDETAPRSSCLSLGAYGQLQWEAGVHRVQRIPVTSAQHKIHTSTVAVSVLPSSEDITVEIDDKDLRWQFFRASGAGGQHVNKTDSAVRLTHLPSGMVVTCQNERSQIQNKELALRSLKERLFQAQWQSRMATETSQRQSHFGQMERSDRIRTYNFPQDRITDHRVGRSWSGIHRFMRQSSGFGELIQLMHEQNRLDRLTRMLQQYAPSKPVR